MPSFLQCFNFIGSSRFPNNFFSKRSIPPLFSVSSVKTTLSLVSCFFKRLCEFISNSCEFFYRTRVINKCPLETLYKICVARLARLFVNTRNLFLLQHVLLSTDKIGIASISNLILLAHRVQNRGFFRDASRLPQSREVSRNVALHCSCSRPFYIRLFASANHGCKSFASGSLAVAIGARSSSQHPSSQARPALAPFWTCGSRCLSECFSGVMRNTISGILPCSFSGKGSCGSPPFLPEVNGPLRARGS